MANNENLRPVRTESEAREKGRAGGKASGKARRRKADFRKTLNLLLTAEIDSEEWTPVLQALGLDSTLEAAVNMAMIKKALAGDVKAYEAIARYSGQSDRTEGDDAEQAAKTEQMKAQTSKITKDPQEQEEDGVNIINDVPKEESTDIGDSDSEIPEDI